MTVAAVRSPTCGMVPQALGESAELVVAVTQCGDLLGDRSDVFLEEADAALESFDGGAVVVVAVIEGVQLIVEPGLLIGKLLALTGLGRGVRARPAWRGCQGFRFRSRASRAMMPASILSDLACWLRLRAKALTLFGSRTLSW